MPKMTILQQTVLALFEDKPIHWSDIAAYGKTTASRLGDSRALATLDYLTRRGFLVRMARGYWRKQKASPISHLLRS
jgi:hypothetical protein